MCKETCDSVGFFSSLSATQHRSGDPSRALHYLNTHSRRPCSASGKKTTCPLPDRCMYRPSIPGQADLSEWVIKGVLNFTLTADEMHQCVLSATTLFCFLPYISSVLTFSDNVGITSMDTSMFFSSITKATGVETFSRKTWVWGRHWAPHGSDMSMKKIFVWCHGCFSRWVPQKFYRSHS